MNKAHENINWENYPSDVTPINEANLNKMDSSIDVIDDRVITLDVTKLNKTDAANLVKSISYDQSNGVFTITYFNGATATIDTKLEKLAVNFGYDPAAQKLIIYLDDGTTQEVDLSALITQYEFLDSDTLAFSIDGAGKVSAFVKDGSITEDKLQPNYLADIRVETARAEASANSAASSATSADRSAASAADSATTATEKATAASASEESAGGSAASAQESANTATQKANDAAGSAGSAATSAAGASESAALASEKAADASNSATSAATSAVTAGEKADAASDSAEDAAISATEAESYAHGGTGTREGEDADNSKYYYEQTKQISQSLNGIIPMGTVAFADLPTDGMRYGHMYNISDAFTSDERFNDGGGIYYGAGNNVIWVSGDKWDVTAGSGVTGVKGNKETTYRQGNVNITPTDIGALAEDGNAVSATKATQDGNGNVIVDTYQTKTGNTNNNLTTFTSADSTSPTAWTDIAVLASGEKHSSIFNKISTMFKNVRWLYKMLGTTDISTIGGGTVTGALNALNTDTLMAWITPVFNIGDLNVGDETFDNACTIDIPEGYTSASICGFSLSGYGYTNCTISRLHVFSNNVIYSVKNVGTAKAVGIDLKVNIMIFKLKNTAM